MDTEAQQYTIDVISAKIDLVCAALFDKKSELEGLNSNEAKEAIKVVMLRLDTLAKVKGYILALKEQYSFIERGINVIEPGDLRIVNDDSDAQFVRKILQGL
ncbi:hypothetical protein NMYAN_210023 [Nitrosomonas nitrosa]|uniref:Uncharacterized protein n=1 Tax=Nitrosomonas nitrosa TaxID=52442 RepID=A0A8H8Z247_9PROT|nr:hypothetical protein [Nitrosomonas nitrosa]CAE6506089.1 hypothetical protein NMYAN_210023 [Nitrosomonas nitrosa]